MTDDGPASFEAYAADRDRARFTDWLRERVAPAWTDATAHRFTRELAADALDDAVFARYLVQDYAFVETLTGVVGHAVGQAPSMAAKAELSGFLATLTGDESDYFERSFDALSVPPAARSAPPIHPVTREFETLLTRAALQGGYEETLAVLVPVEWAYYSWATDAADAAPSRFYLREWIELHADPAFEAFVEWLRGELDEHGPALDARRTERVERLFRHAVDLEAAFFDAAYGAAATGDGEGAPW